MGVTALMKCSGINTREGYFKQKQVIAGTVELRATYTNDESMREYADATPSGNMELSIDNPEALIQFTPGKFYKITIEETKI